MWTGVWTCAARVQTLPVIVITRDTTESTCTQCAPSKQIGVPPPDASPSASRRRARTVNTVPTPRNSHACWMSAMPSKSFAAAHCFVPDPGGLNTRTAEHHNRTFPCFVSWISAIGLQKTRAIGVGEASSDNSLQGIARWVIVDIAGGAVTILAWLHIREALDASHGGYRRRRRGWRRERMRRR